MAVKTEKAADTVYPCIQSILVAVLGKLIYYARGSKKVLNMYVILMSMSQLDWGALPLSISQYFLGGGGIRPPATGRGLGTRLLCGASHVIVSAMKVALQLWYPPY